MESSLVESPTDECKPFTANFLVQELCKYLIFLIQKVGVVDVEDEKEGAEEKFEINTDTKLQEAAFKYS